MALCTSSQAAELSTESDQYIKHSLKAARQHKE